MSMMRPVLNLFLRLAERPHLARAKTPEKLRRSFEMKARFWFRAPRGTTYRSDVIEGVPVIWTHGPGAKEEGPVILYFHGGGYVFGSARTHQAMLGKLSHLSGLAACLADYRLAPEHSFPAALEDALSVYIHLSQRYRGVVIGGDSAGGGLALSLMAEILKHGLQKPLGCFAFSPLTDLGFTGVSIGQNGKADVVLPVERVDEMAEMYLQGANPLDPRTSPLFGVFSGAPPVWIAAGTTEILLDDTRRMAAHLRNEGVKVTEVVEKDLPHVWPIFHNLLPEAGKTLKQVAAWIKPLSERSGDN
jgi:acetyl esterase/lipase